MSRVVEHRIICWACDEVTIRWIVWRPGVVPTVPEKCPECGASWSFSTTATVEVQDASA